MESAAVLRSFEYAVGTNSLLKFVLQRPGMVTMNGAAYCGLSKLPACGGKNLSSRKRHGALLVSCAKTSEATISAKAKGDPNGAVLSNGALEKKTPISATFPTGFEALLTEVCDETKIAELKVKLGAFEIHMKRNIDGPAIPAPVVPHETASSAPSKPVVPPPPPSKSSAEKVSPFTNVSVEKAAKLAALEASGSSGYVIVSSPTVGSFRRARTLKGKKQPPACKEGDVIKEGQVIGFLDQFGTELPVKSDVAGEVLKLLFNDGEAVGYGDPLIAVLPSFHSIK
ncbi:uncharacterized protein LOC130997965 [Salvia miltiorrhiza]|uniref:uncharacterized protein LOC130997965 n=1 Tax=Salvia miltiorrhiza TaxID=226208 RepID=UPI0025AC71A5|nr:uncharacterized protein LOC130997965 [Salvia miltiorrhiza]XP_057779386.1 uncharacterized protein LOC130997965 [Salvia miltiorrhiza]